MKFAADRYNLICGKTGSGKSTYLGLLRSAMNTRVIVFDSNNQHGESSYDRIVPGDNIVSDFEDLIRLAMKSDSRCHIIVEEAQEVVGTRCSPFLKRWLRTGRNAGVTATFVTQLPGDLHPSIVSNCTSVAVFRLQRPEDKGYISSWLGVSRNDVESLGKHDFLIVEEDEEGTKVRKCSLRRKDYE